MGKASRKRSEPRGPKPSPIPEPPSWAATALAIVSIVGVVVAAVSTWVHYQVTSSGGLYTSFCNVGESFDCDAVVTSRFGYLFGIPVSVWGLGFYGMLFVVARRAKAVAKPTRDAARAWAFVLAVSGGLFSLYLAGVSAFALGTFCLLCIGLYAVSAASLGAAWMLAAPVSSTLGPLWGRWKQRPAIAAVAAVVVVTLLLVPAWLEAPVRMTREEVFRADPEFYDLYTSQPIVETSFAGGQVRGSESAPLTLVEFSDFECPHCQRAHVTLKDLLPRYGDDVRFVFFHFPLSNECNEAVEAEGHAHACEAARAAECAAREGRFDTYVNVLFAHQSELSRESLVDYAGGVGLDEDAFAGCLDDPGIARKVKENVATGIRAGVRSTPTFFLNGRKLEGNLPYERWLLALSVELDRR